MMTNRYITIRAANKGIQASPLTEMSQEGYTKNKEGMRRKQSIPAGV